MELRRYRKKKRRGKAEDELGRDIFVVLHLSGGYYYRCDGQDGDGVGGPGGEVTSSILFGGQSGDGGRDDGCSLVRL